MVSNKEHDSSVARIIAHHRGRYRVRFNSKELWAEIAGKMIYTAGRQADYPVVGDWVRISKFESDQALIHEILPRKTLLQRKAYQL